MSVSEKIVGAVECVTKKWKKQRKAEERAASAMLRREYAMTCSYRYTIKDAAREIMREAYMKASANNTLPANARQIMYGARGYILEKTGEQRLGDSYFTQRLLPDYIRDFPDETADWDVVYDDRGHLHEPHTGREVPLGTVAVRDYLEKIRDSEIDGVLDVRISGRTFPTVGPPRRYGAILFIEKEGFIPLFKAVKLAERYDIAIMSTKGLSVTAARSLVDKLCAEETGVPLLVLHDFDKPGFSILGTLQRDTRRYEFSNSVEVIDLGLRLEDVEENELESEPVVVGKNWRWNLQDNGATEEEIEFLCSGRRVELNAFPSDQFVHWIETKLNKLKIRKVVPQRQCLAEAYRRALEITLLDAEVESVREEVHERAQKANLPRALVREVKSRVDRNSELSWDAVISEMVTKSLEENV